MDSPTSVGSWALWSRSEMNKKALSAALLAFGLLVVSASFTVHAATPVSGDFSFPTYNNAYGPVTVGTGSPTAFNSTASGGSPPYTFNWNFSDGTTASGAYLSHVFSAAGTYNVTLAVVDSALGATMVSHLVTVVSSYRVDLTTLVIDPVGKRHIIPKGPSCSEAVNTTLFPPLKAR